MIHKGEIIEKAVRASGISITVLAKRLNKSRRHIYDIFENANVSLDVILQIGKIIHYDFSADFSELSTTKHYYINSIEGNVVNDNIELYESDFKQKYLELLEKYNDLLSKYVELIEQKGGN